jgi:hypothetical protein
MSNVVNMQQAAVVNEQSGPLLPIDPYVGLKRHARRTSRRIVLGKKVKFVNGRWPYGLKDEYSLPLGTLMVIAFTSIVFGWTRMQDKKPAEQILGLVVEDFQPPPRKDLGWLDESEWELGLNGQPEDPWKLTYAVPMKRVGPKGEVFTYIASSAANIPVTAAFRQVGDLIDMIADRGAFHRGQFPIVELGAEPFPTRFGQNKYKPSFQIKGWEDERLFQEAVESLGRDDTDGVEPSPQAAPDPRNGYREASQSLGVRRQQTVQRHIQANPQPMPPRRQLQSRARDDFDDFIEERDDYRDAVLSD